MAEPSDVAATATPQSQPSPPIQSKHTDETVNTSQQNFTKQSEFQQQPTQNLHSQDSTPNFIKLSHAFSAFQLCFAELQQHIDSIRTLIDSMRPPHTTNTTPLSVSSPPAALTPEPEPEPSSESDPSEEEEKEVKYTRSELERLCEMMDGRGLRKYMINNLSDINGLVEEVPKALKLSSNPARLVLECLGKFYLQGSKAYVKGSPIINGRKASILVLECFLLMGIDEGVENLRLRMRNLLANPFKKNMSGSLTRSNVFMAKIPEIIEGMVKEKMEINAVDNAYTFGIEGRFNPQRLVTSFLRESEKPLKKMKGNSQGSLAAVNEAKKMRSVIKCLRRHSIDLSELLHGWQINENIMSLEKEIATGEKKMAQKRKIAETEAPGRFSNKEAKNSHLPNPRLQQEIVVNHVDSNSTLLEGGTAGHMYGYSLSPSVLHGPVGGSIHENVGPLGHGRTPVDSTPGQIGSHTGQLMDCMVM
ncbi:hypothetical protein K7X08_034539 [Anisodus acutangulus]|uniref:FRIGIDA-like protein n=1 Tax=Anisodus acutangulus TaxID=402998 RepID=A0A9Q1LJA3_9SOLA|nr:hypothetical protein K7X08_034539 [Anisodus acutangulus]